jgi:hypothetical protein
MTRVRVHETVGGRRVDADDNSTTERTDMTTIRDQFLAEGEARERELTRHLAGDFTVPSPSWATSADGETIPISTRDAFYAREAEMSRRPPSGRIFSRESAGDAASVDDDDDAVSLPAVDSRTAFYHREAERSRLPARGSR